MAPYEKNKVSTNYQNIIWKNVLCKLSSDPFEWSKIWKPRLILNYHHDRIVKQKLMLQHLKKVALK